jgi:hypothetical protein
MENEKVTFPKVGVVKHIWKFEKSVYPDRVLFKFLKFNV